MRKEETKGIRTPATATPQSVNTAPVIVRLPGENGLKPSVGCEPFPSRLYAFVWRNWTCVPLKRLAEVLDTVPENVQQIAVLMGLSPQSSIEPEWAGKGYITVLRRNWHLLPYTQLVTLLGITREQLRVALEDDDFLYHKLGDIKPACEPLRYTSPSTDECAAASHLSDWSHEEGLADTETTADDLRFSFVNELSKPDPMFQPVVATDDSPFTLRFIFSYFANYGDPLIEPGVPSYPEGLLQRLAAAGVNGVWVHTVLRTLATDPTFPEFGADCEQRIDGLRTLVERGKKYGIAVFLYLNEPRAMQTSFFEAAPERAAMRGVSAMRNEKAVVENSCLCTSHPEVRRWMRDALTTVFQQVSGLGGVFTITASENRTNCASHRRWKDCPNCQNRTDAEIIAEVNATIEEGVHRGNPNARTIVWDWGWNNHGDAQDFIPRLPKRCWFMSVSEWGLPITRGGIPSTILEYSISAVGPGPRATRHWELAREVGLKTVAKVQVGATWEFSAVPYLPTLELVAEHARNLASVGIDGVMLSWSLGCYPSPNLEVFQAFTKGATDIGPVLDRVAERHYGADAVPLVRQAWHAYSEGFRDYPYGAVYCGPHHMGPANPLYFQPTGYAATMVGIPYDDLPKWCSFYPPEVWIEQMEKVRAGFSRGNDLWRGLVDQLSGAKQKTAQRELGMFRAIELHFASCVNQARFILIRNLLIAAGDETEQAAARTTLRQIVSDELAVTKAMLPLVRADARIGYESSNQYYYIPQDLMEKVLGCRQILQQLNEIRI